MIKQSCKLAIENILSLAETWNLLVMTKWSAQIELTPVWKMQTGNGKQFILSGNAKIACKILMVELGASVCHQDC